MTNENRIQLMQKVKKCLALSSSSNEHEAAAALRKAQMLMRECNISEADMLAAEACESRVSARATWRPAAWETELVNRIAEAFDCVEIFSAGGDRGNWIFIGCGAAPDVAGYAYNVLMRQAKRARTNYIKTRLNRCKPANKTRRADVFCHGWVHAVSDLLERATADAQQEKAVAAYLAVKYPHLSSSSPINRNGKSKMKSQDVMSGYFSGKQAVLNHGVGGGADELKTLSFGGAA